jgi:hypothetical protein
MGQQTMSVSTSYQERPILFIGQYKPAWGCQGPLERPNLCKPHLYDTVNITPVVPDLGELGGLNLGGDGSNGRTGVTSNPSCMSIRGCALPLSLTTPPSG